MDSGTLKILELMLRMEIQQLWILKIKPITLYSFIKLHSKIQLLLTKIHEDKVF